MTITWQQLLDETHERVSSMPNTEPPTRIAVERAARDLFESIAMKAMHGARVTIPGFGVFTVRTRVARNVRNPATKEMMRLPACKHIGFRCSKLISR